MNKPSFIFSFKIICVALIVFVVCSRAFMYTDDNNYMFYFYRLEKDTADVISLGSSHCYSSINTVKLYRETGITAYNLAGPSQPMWVSYHYLLEGLKYQNPKLVIIDCYTAKNAEYDKEVGYIYNNITSMRPSVNKYHALKATREFPDFWETWFGFPITHEKFSQLTEDNYRFDPSYKYCGFVPRMEDNDNELGEYEDAEDEKDVTRIPEKAEVYLRKIIELCQDRGIKVLMVNAPWPENNERSQKMYNYVDDLAGEYGIDFINGCLLFDELRLDTETDFDGTHLNYLGAEKWTAYLESYIVEHYSLPDHRGEGDNEWERAAVLYDEFMEQENDVEN